MCVVTRQVPATREGTGDALPAGGLWPWTQETQCCVLHVQWVLGSPSQPWVARVSRVWRTADCKHRLATERAGASRGQAAGEGCYQSC